MSLHQLRRERGAASVWMVFATIIVLAVAGLVYDGGGLIATKRQAINVAEQAARAGAAGRVITVMLPDQRDDVRKLMKQAGISAATVRVAPGHPAIAELAG